MKYLATFFCCHFTFGPPKALKSPAHQTVYQAGLLEGTFASMATETTQSGASNCVEGLCLLCEGRFSPGELYRMFFWSRQGKQQQLCTSSWGGMYLCVCVHECESAQSCVRIHNLSLYLCACVELMEKATLSSAQVITYCRPFTKKKKGGEKCLAE